MNVAENRYKLNGVDMFAAYGFVPQQGASDGLLTPRKRKPVYSNNWAERNGAEWDLDAPVKYEDRQIKVNGVIIANSESDFHAKFNALKSAFANTGYQVLSCLELGSAYDAKVFLTEISGVKRHTRLKLVNKIAVELTLELQEVQDEV